MFALLFDRKSLTMTLLALGGMGLLLFVSGFALGSYLNGGLEHLGVVAQETSFTNRRLRTTAPASRPSNRRTPAPAVSAPRIVEEAPAPDPVAEPMAAPGDETAPPADWVPLEDGGSWPGEEPGVEPAPAEISTVETARTLVADETDPEAVLGEPRVAANPAEAPRRAQGFYYVQLGTFSREELAREKQAEVESRIAENDSVAPFLASVTSRDGRTAYAVRVGPFPTRGAAREAAAGYGRASVVWSSAGSAL